MGYDHRIREQADRVRNIDLVRALLHAECTQDTRDQNKWHTPHGVISVTAQQFINWRQGTGGGGAIDLVMHLMGFSFLEAVAWLVRAFPDVTLGKTRPEPLPQSPERSFQLPRRDNRRAPQVMNYLHHQRNIPLNLLQSLYADGKIYADFRGNAVFLLLGKEKKVFGAELRGTGKQPWKGMAPGSNKNKGCFSLKTGDHKQVVLCESAIDAISCSCFYPERIVLSTAGVCSDRPWLTTVISMGYQVLCAFDADEAGDRFAVKMIQKHPEIQRLRPPFKDWNEALQQTIT